MAENLVIWPSKREPISKIGPSDGCGRDAVPLAVERWYDFPEFGGYLGNVGLNRISGRDRLAGVVVPAVAHGHDAGQPVRRGLQDRPGPGRL